VSAQDGWTLNYYDRPLTEEAPALECAGLWIRLGARLVDNIAAGLLALIPAALLAAGFRLTVRATQDTALTSAARDAQNHDAYVATVAGFLLGLYVVGILYEWLTTAVGGGAGKRIGRIRIVSARDYARPGLRRAGVRAGILLGLGSVPVVGAVLVLLDVARALWDDDHRTWHDRLAGTIVVYA
jgi:uncharacterized RDD family membrane protein YckC